MCNTSNAQYVLELWKQTSLQQKSETVSAKQRIVQTIISWISGIWASNTECLTTLCVTIYLPIYHSTGQFP